ncbi:hypothetical protein ACIBCA_28880 [Kitasatospora sp. NPDC051170]|uniref:hypothetical protein n=1 Tax=Kitasatospora sp. NPDC051170 TaxID=3364056 RepID=UPI0037AD6732
MDRSAVLRSLVTNGTATEPARLAELAGELDLPVADLLVVAGHPVPPELLPPERDAKVMQEFARRVGECEHDRLAELESYVRSLPHLDAPGPFVQTHRGNWKPAESGFAAVVNGLIRNRGFGVAELPFMGLSRPTVVAMVQRWSPAGRNSRFELCALAGAVGWTWPDLFAIAGEPYDEGYRQSALCRHVGMLFAAAVHLTTDQLIEATTVAAGMRIKDHERGPGPWQHVCLGWRDDES